jgi:uncharacterized Zn-binding protein involved in type VI secretion
MALARKSNITSVEPTVLIAGQPAVIAGQSADASNLAMISGEPMVLIAGQPATTLHNQATGEQHHVSGKPTVLIAGRPAAEE